MPDAIPSAPAASLVERAAERLRRGRTAPAPRPSPTAAPPPDPEPPRPAAKVQPAVPLDLARLRAEGFLTPDAPLGPVAEELRLIKRHLLEEAFRGDGGNLILVTSAVAGEGKTTLALNLALLLSAERDLHVLAIDGDSRRRSLGNHLGVGDRPGLMELVAGRVLPPDVLLRSSIRNLAILPAGAHDPLGPEMLASRQAGTALREIGRRYKDRVILIDTAPLLVSSEAAILSAYVGQVVIVVEKDRTTRRALDLALRRLGPGPSIKCVLNMATPAMGQSHGECAGYG